MTAVEIITTVAILIGIAVFLIWLNRTMIRDEVRRKASSG